MDDKRIAAAERKHLIPLDSINGYEVRPGFYGINGAPALREGVNFTICSMEATSGNCFCITEEKKNHMRVFLFPNTTGAAACIP